MYFVVSRLDIIFWHIPPQFRAYATRKTKKRITYRLVSLHLYHLLNKKEEEEERKECIVEEQMRKHIGKSFEIRTSCVCVRKGET